MLLRKLLLGILLLFAELNLANAQVVIQSGYEGTEFYVMFPPNSSGSTLTLYLSSRTAANVNVSTPLAAGGLNTNYTVAANGFTQVNVAATYGATNMQFTPINTPYTNAIKITSDVPITVYGLNSAAASLDSWLSIPTAMLGTEYVSVGFAGGGSANQFAYNTLIATEPGTTTINVTVPPGQTVAGKPSNFVINLNQGQSYSIQASCGAAAGCEATGIRYVSNKKIAMFGAGSFCQYPEAGNKGGYASCGGPLDHLVEMIPPVSAWGGTYVVPVWKFAGADQTASSKVTTQGSYLRIVSAVPGSVTVNISGQPPVVLNGVGDFMDRLIADNVVVSATEKIYVYLVMASTCKISNVPSSGIGDGAFTCVAAAEQWGREYAFLAPAVPGNAPNSYITIIKEGSGGTVTLDGTVQTGFTQVGTSNYYVKSAITISTGVHRVIGDIPVVVYSYGVQVAGTYTNLVNGSTLKNIVLPIRFINFNSRILNNQVALNWQMGTEQNIAKYVIERKNQQEFVALDTISSKNIASGSINYTYIDEKPLAGTNYYRIKQIDNNGSVFYSSVISDRIKSTQNQLVNAFINASGDLELMVNVQSNDIYQFEIFNIQGARVIDFSKELQEGVNAITKFVDGFSNGVYIIKMRSQGKDLGQLKFVK